HVVAATDLPRDRHRPGARAVHPLRAADRSGNDRHGHCGTLGRAPRDRRLRMRVLVWVAEGTWPGCIDAARELLPEAADVTLLHVTGEDMAAAARGAFAGLLGRGHPHGVDPGSRLTTAAGEA